MRELNTEELTLWQALRLGRKNGKTSQELQRETGFNRRKICGIVESLRSKDYPVGALREKRTGYFIIETEEEREVTVKQIRNQAFRELQLASQLERAKI